MASGIGPVDNAQRIRDSYRRKAEQDKNTFEQLQDATKENYQSVLEDHKKNSREALDKKDKSANERVSTIKDRFEKDFQSLKNASYDREGKLIEDYESKLRDQDRDFKKDKATILENSRNTYKQRDEFIENERNQAARTRKAELRELRDDFDKTETERNIDTQKRIGRIESEALKKLDRERGALESKLESTKREANTRQREIKDAGDRRLAETISRNEKTLENQEINRSKASDRKSQNLEEQFAQVEDQIAEKSRIQDRRAQLERNKLEGSLTQELLDNREKQRIELDNNRQNKDMAMSDLKRNSEAEKAQLRADSEKKLRNQKLDNSLQSQFLQNEAGKDINQVRRDYSKELANKERATRDDFNKIQGDLEKRYADYTNNREGHFEENLKERDYENMALKKDNSRKEATLRKDSLERQRDQDRVWTARMNNAQELHKKDVSNLLEENQRTTNEMARDVHEKLSLKDMESKATYERAKNAYDNNLKLRQGNYDNRMNEIKEDYDKSVRNKDEFFSEAMETWSRGNKKDRLIKNIEDQRRTDQMVNNSGEALRSQAANYEYKIDTLRREYEGKIEDMRKTQEKTLKDIRDKNETQMAMLRGSFETQLAQDRAQTEAREKGLRDSFRQEMESEKARHVRELKRLGKA